MNEIQNLIKKFRNQVNIWNKDYPYMIIYNEDLDTINEENFSKVKYILVGDNPGKTEAELKRYFVGPAGVSARIFFERFLVTDFRKEVICLNKTPITTSQTKVLKGADKQILLKTQEYMADLSIKLQEQIKDSKIVITGFMDARKNDVWKINTNDLGSAFFSKIKKNSKLENVFIIKHFSFSQIYNDLTIEKFEKLNGRNVLDIIGKENAESLFRIGN